MSDERRWTLWVDSEGQTTNPLEWVATSVEVMPVAEHEAALARVKRERDNLAATLRNAQERAQAWEATARKWADAANERDALRAQAKALTEALTSTVDLVNAMRYYAPTLNMDAERVVRDALAAARDAAAATAPDS